MSFSAETEPLSPHTIIELEEVTQLHAFEDALSQYIYKDMKPEAIEYWNGRKMLRDELRPMKFNGTIANIILQVMDNPAEELETAQSRGFRFKKGTSQKHQISRFRDSEENNSAVGLTFIADAKSSGRGVIGQVQAELYYHPESYAWGRATSIQRILTKPKIETQNFIVLEKESSRIALAVLREGLKHVRPNPFHN